ncbi:hypothetical protein LIER_12279 [Lithospermum erythrorhizon]|uniref:Uncharacterized protein n=1 Tax=Lithospermum erythrorhizon TaxID=34254 RepID=A0AAV3PSV9_LITER
MSLFGSLIVDLVWLLFQLLSLEPFALTLDFDTSGDRFGKGLIISTSILPTFEHPKNRVLLQIISSRISETIGVRVISTDSVDADALCSTKDVGRVCLCYFFGGAAKSIFVVFCCFFRPPVRPSVLFSFSMYNKFCLLYPLLISSTTIKGGVCLII